MDDVGKRSVHTVVPVEVRSGNGGSAGPGGGSLAVVCQRCGHVCTCAYVCACVYV